MHSAACPTLLCWLSLWLPAGAASRAAPVGWQQVQGLLPVLFLAAGALDRSDHRWPASLYRLHSLLLTLSIPRCLLGGPVGESLCQVSNTISHFISKSRPALEHVMHPGTACLLRFVNPPCSGFTAHTSDCGPGRCPRPWWILPEAWLNAGAWESLRRRRSSGQNGTVTRSAEEAWTWTFCIRWKKSVRLAAPLTEAREVRKKLSLADTNDCDPVSLHLLTSLTVAGASELGQYHALNVMEWVEVQRVSGSKVLLLRIRNPWGRSCWGGAWIGR